MYWLGQHQIDKAQWMMADSWQDISRLKRELATTSVQDIIEMLDSFSRFWLENNLFENEVLSPLIRESGFSEEEVKKTLALLPGLLSRENLERRVRGEFQRAEVLDRFVKMPQATHLMRAVPLGVVLHVTAGNVFLSSIDSLIMGLLTKNISLLKVSSQNTFFPFFFAQKFIEFDKKGLLSNKFSILHWKGGDEVVESFVKRKINAIIAWGGEEMISSYRKNLPEAVKFLDFGPKISFQVISKEGLKGKDLKNIASKIIQDISPWDQGACASPQNLYLQDGIDAELLLKVLDEELTKAPKGGALSEDEAVEILKEKYRGYYSELMQNGAVYSGNHHLLHLEENKFLKPSPLHQSLIVKYFKDEEDLYNHVGPFAYYLQSCSYLLGPSEKNAYLNLLSLSGIKRFAPLGTITWGMEGAPHDGRLVLRELTHFVGDEARIQDYGEEVGKILNSEAMKKAFETIPHPAGYIFSSGGTTGEPKYSHYSYAEFDYMTDMLAYNLRAQGIKAGMMVANLFVAGNMWSSFMAVEKALEKIGAIQLPIGGLCSNENIMMYLNKFRPQVVMGIPSMLVMNAEYAKGIGIELRVDKVFYAGEALSETRRKYLSETWKTSFFGSAGYASVDGGVIGYQCKHCAPGEHHIFSDLIDLKIIEGEGVVTSLARHTMPVVNYRTGDRMEWIKDCECGRPDKRFKLLGRIDNLIMVWGSRIILSDIEKTFQLVSPEVMSYQLILSDKEAKEHLEVIYEASQMLDEKKWSATLYDLSRDVRDSLSFDEFQKNLTLTKVGTGLIQRNPRTGKISLLKDQRH